MFGSASCLVLLLASIMLLSSAAPDVKTPSSGPLSWHRTQQPQTLHGLMMSIDERLRNMDSIRYDLVLEQIDRRLEVLETRMRRLDTSIQDRFDKVDRNLNSRDLKEELSEEKMSHKIRDVVDTGYDRFNRRLTYSEERLELSFKKLQTNVEGLFNRIEKHQEDIQSELVDVVATLDDIKTHSVQSEDKLNSTHKTIQQHLNTILLESASRDQLQKITGSLEHIGNKLNSTTNMWGSHQSDRPYTAFNKDIVESIRQENNNLGIKISNTYNELWRRFMSLESLVKDLIKFENSTQREIFDELRSLLSLERRDFLSDSQENFLEIALDALERKIQKRLSDLGRKFDDKFDTLSATQNLVIDSCFEGGICRSLESRVSQVLEKIIVMFTTKTDIFSNRTEDMDSLLLELMELVKSQHSQMIRTVTHTTNMVITLTKDSSEANKQLQSSVVDLAERTETSLQEIQEEIQEIANVSGKLCTDTDKHSYESSGVERELSHAKFIKIYNESVTIPSPKEINGTDELPVQKPEHDKGVVKITTENSETGVNVTHASEQTAVTKKQNKTKDRQNMHDESTLNLIEMLNSNLTNIQVLLRFLNDKVNSKTIEAIIQSTDTEPNDNTRTENTQNVSSNEQNDDFDFTNERGSIPDNERNYVDLYVNKTANENSNMGQTEPSIQYENSTMHFFSHLKNNTLNNANVKFSSLKLIVTNFLQLLCSNVANNNNATRTTQNQLKQIIAKLNSNDTYREVESICKLYKNALTSTDSQLSKLSAEYDKSVLTDASRHVHTEDISLRI